MSRESNWPAGMASPSHSTQTSLGERRAFFYEPVNQIPLRLPSEPLGSPSLDGASIDLQLNADNFRHAYPPPYSAKASSRTPGKGRSVYGVRSTSNSGTATPFPELEENMPKGRPRGESDLGRPSLRSRNASLNAAGLQLSPVHGEDDDEEDGHIANTVSYEATKSQLPLELLASILIPLPYLLGSLVRPLTAAIDHSKHSANHEAVEELLEEVASTALPVTTRNSSLFEACALASGTLLVVGILGRFQRRSETQQRPRASSTVTKAAATSPPTSFLTRAYWKRFLVKVATVALPFLATVEIGGVKTGLFLLAAAAEGLIAPDVKTNIPPKSKWRKLIRSHKWICALFAVSMLVDLFMLDRDKEPASIVRGYAALIKSVVLLKSPLPTASNVLSQKAISPLIISASEATATAFAGLALAVTTIWLAFVLSAVPTFDMTSTLLYAAALVAAASLFTISSPALLRSPSKTGYAIGLFLCLAFGLASNDLYSMQSQALAGLCAFAYIAVRIDINNAPVVSTRPSTPRISHQSPHLLHDHSHIKASRVTKFLLNRTEHWPVLHSILIEKDSRRIAYFMVINLSFMFVQTFYAVVSGSLGLLSDSIHMLFDCVGLFAGLVAAVMSKWPPNTKFPYGYGKVEVLSGLGNGIFLMIISVEIIWESFERVMEGAELKRMNELLLVSVGGLLVNLIGLTFTGHHHHGHSHDHSHGHSHTTHGNDTLDLALPNGAKKDEQSVAKSPAHSHPHQSHHHHGHANENMAGIYLHILADTMGSVAVIISTILSKYTNWYGWDPIASCVIAILIILASYPLVVGSAKQLLLTLPEEVEYTLRNTLQGITEVQGVAGYAVPRFWLDERNTDEFHSDSHSHAHSHSHQPVHSHEHHEHIDDLHGHDHSAPHPDAHTHLPHGSHDVRIHAHGHSDSHSHSHSHSHQHLHDHMEQGKDSHDHGHVPNGLHTDPHLRSPAHSDNQKLVGVIHIFASPRAELEEVRIRVEQFLKDQNMDVLVHVEREGLARCWCGVSQPGGHLRSKSVVAM